MHTFNSLATNRIKVIMIGSSNQSFPNDVWIIVFTLGTVFFVGIWLIAMYPLRRPPVYGKEVSLKRAIVLCSSSGTASAFLFAVSYMGLFDLMHPQEIPIWIVLGGFIYGFTIMCSLFIRGIWNISSKK